MASAVAKLPKPKLRGHFQDYLNKTFIYASVAAVVTGVGYYYGVLMRHQNRRENFYKDFNAEKEFERLRDLGFFWSVPPKDSKKALYDWLGEP